MTSAMAHWFMHASSPEPAKSQPSPSATVPASTQVLNPAEVEHVVRRVAQLVGAVGVLVAVRARPTPEMTPRDAEDLGADLIARAHVVGHAAFALLTHVAFGALGRGRERGSGCCSHRRRSPRRSSTRHRCPRARRRRSTSPTRTPRSRRTSSRSVAVRCRWSRWWPSSTSSSSRSSTRWWPGWSTPSSRRRPTSLSPPVPPSPSPPPSSPAGQPASARAHANRNH